MAPSGGEDHTRELRRLVQLAALAAAILAAFPVLTPRTVSAAENPEIPIAFTAPAGMFVVGEDLLYEVSYSIFSLGTVRIEVIDTARCGAEMEYRAKAFIDSYKGVPFVNLHYVFYSEICRGMYSNFFASDDTKDPSRTPYVTYDFQYDKNLVRVEMGEKPGHLAAKQIVDTVTSRYQDGLSLFFYARAHLHDRGAMDVPTYVNEKKVTTFINFVGKREKQEIDAVKYPIATVKLEGRADFVGIFGLTGGFSGWFSDDEAAVPIVAKMNVIIGSVHLELIKWQRPGWNPPRAQEE